MSISSNSLQLNSHRVIVLAVGFVDGKAPKVVSSLGTESPSELHCSHEQADTGIIFHAVKVNYLFQAADTRY